MLSSEKSNSLWISKTVWSPVLFDVIIVSTSNMKPATGNVVADQFALGSLLGSGSFGEIYEATLSENSRVALKVECVRSIDELEKQIAGSAEEGSSDGEIPEGNHSQLTREQQVQRLKRMKEKSRVILKLEALVLFRLQVFGIAPKFIGFGRCPMFDVAYLAMELLGDNLLQWRSVHGTLPVAIQKLVAPRSLGLVSELTALNQQIIIDAAQITEDRKDRLPLFNCIDTQRSLSISMQVLCQLEAIHSVGVTHMSIT